MSAEVAIEAALLDRLRALTLSPAVQVAYPNVAFTPPAAGANVCWFRGTFLPATTFELGISFNTPNQHYGIFQVDVFYGMGSGELQPARMAASIIEWFKRGTMLTKETYTVQILRAPYRGRLIDDDPWVMIPVSIPYLAYAANP